MQPGDRTLRSFVSRRMIRERLFATGTESVVGDFHEASEAGGKKKQREEKKRHKGMKMKRKNTWVVDGVRSFYNPKMGLCVLGSQHNRRVLSLAQFNTLSDSLS